MHAIFTLLATQDSLATIEQLHRAGASDGLIRQRLSTGEWERLDPHVIGLSSVAFTWRRQVRTASLAAGTDVALSHGTAARLHRFDGFDRETSLHLTVCGSTHRTSVPGVVVHRCRLLHPKHCTTIDGMLVVSRALALVQIAGSHGRDDAAKALDGMLRDGDNPSWIRDVATTWKRPGVSGAGRVLSLLDERVDGRLPRSWFQRLTERVLATRGLAMVDEHPVLGEDGRVLAELDLALPQLQIGIECQSWYWHSTPSTRAADAARRRRLRLLGWEIVEVWWSDLGRADEIAEEIVFLVTRRLQASITGIVGVTTLSTTG